MQPLKSIILAVFLSIASPAFAEYTYYNGETYSGTLVFVSGRFTKPVTFKNLPRFEDYPTAAPTSTATDIDWKSHPRAWEFRTRLRNGLKAPANFGGVYSVVMHGCGSSCQSVWVIERKSGRVMGNFSTTTGAVFDNKSRLLVANMPDRNTDLSDSWGRLSDVVFYVADAEELRTLKHISIEGMLGNQDEN